MRLRNTEHLELSTKIDSKCTHKKDSLHVFLDAKSDLQKTEPKRRFFSKPNRNRTELEKSIPHIPIRQNYLKTIRVTFLKHSVDIL